MPSSRLAAVVLMAALAPVAPRAAAEDRYEIGPQDVLSVVVAGRAEMTGEFAVDREGVLPFPVLGRVAAAGLTAQELERKLTVLLADGYLKRPQVSLSVKEYRSQQVFVTGQVQRPGRYSLKGDRSLLALLGELGSLPAEAGHEIVIIRPPKGSLPQQPSEVPGDRAGQGPDAPRGGEVLRVSLRRLQSGPLEHNVALQAGDTVYVPKAALIYVTGNVARPGPYRFEEGITLAEALTLAGGITERGSSRRVKVTRTVEGQAKPFKVKMTDPVQPGDMIVVPERFF